MQEHSDTREDGASGGDTTRTVTEITGFMQASINDTRQLLEALLSLQDTHASVETMALHIARIGEQIEQMDEINRLVYGADFETLRQSVTLASSLVTSLNESIPQLLEIWRLTGRAIQVLHQSTAEQATALLREVEFMEKSLPRESGNGTVDEAGSAEG